jgi:ribosomal protein S18 acetylase RimI-like enzyme
MSPRRSVDVTIQAIERSPLHESTHDRLITERPAEPTESIDARVLGSIPGTARMSSATLTVTTRPMIDDDSMLLFELYASARAEELSRSGWATPQQRSFFRMQAMNQEQFYLRHHAHLDRRTVCINGFSAGRVLVDRGADVHTIVDFGILPSFRARGVGSLVIAQVLADAAAAGVPVELEIHPGNEAVRLCRRLGFDVIDERDERIRMRWSPATLPVARLASVGSF